MKKERTQQTISKSQIEEKAVTIGKSKTTHTLKKGDSDGSGSSESYKTIPAASRSNSSHGQSSSGNIVIYDNSEAERLREQNTL